MSKNLEQFKKIVAHPILLTMISAKDCNDYNSEIVKRCCLNAGVAVHYARSKMSKSKDTTYLIYKLITVVQPPNDAEVSYLAGEG